MSSVPTPTQVFVSKESFESSDPADLVAANVAIVNALLEEYLRADEIAPDALRSYFTDFYRAQVQNGGFAQFVYNSAWDERVITCVYEGLNAFGGDEHLELFERCARTVESMDDETLDEFLNGSYFEESDVKDTLGTHDEELLSLMASQDLPSRNAAWLRSLPHLVALDYDDLEAEIERQAAALPDREERAAQAEEEEPELVQILRALADEADQELVRITAGDPSHEVNGEQVLAWHFLTDKGPHYMVELGGIASMYDAETDELVSELEIVFE